ncbi:MAG: FAD:protein FMN transferase [Saprospiraceae bacterium]
MITALEKVICKSTARLMGNHFEITVVADNSTLGEICIQKGINEIKRIEKLLTTFSEDSQTNQINKMAGIQAVAIDKEVFDLIERAQRISSITQGAFDITYGSIDKRFWNFDTTMNHLPDSILAKQAVKLINYKNVILLPESHSVFLRLKGMRIGFGGIGKGYAAECAKNVLLRNGISSGIINASGDLCTWGRQPDGLPWSIGIADPNTRLDSFSYMELHDMSIATSGNYEKFVMIDGKRYAHTIDPHTGYPVQGIKSVTIVTPNAELCDAFTTPVMVMGVARGLHMINQIKHMGCIIIDESNTMFTSKNINIIY